MRISHSQTRRERCTCTMERQCYESRTASVWREIIMRGATGEPSAGFAARGRLCEGREKRVRIWCAARSKQMTVHYDSRKLLVTMKNAGRLEHEKDVILTIEGYRTGSDREQRDAHLVRNEMAVNTDMLIVGELRVLTGMSRQRK